MDLIYADENRIDQGVMDAYELDMHCTASVGSLHVEGRYTP